MKPILTLLVLISFSISKIHAQEQSQNSKPKFYFEADPLTKFNLLTFDSNGLETVGEEKSNFFPLRFKIVHSQPVTIGSTKYFEISFYTIKDEGNMEVQKNDGKTKEALKGNAHFINSNDNNIYFLIDAERLLSDSSIKKCIVPSTAFVYGANISTPFKYRPSVGTINYIFSPEVNLGGYVGWKIPIDINTNSFITVTFSPCFSSIEINNQDINSTAGTSPSNGTAWGVSESLGLILQTKDFQIGALWGHDFVSGQMGKNWLYNQMPWYSFSVGYSFLGGSKAQTNKINKETDAAQSAVQGLIKNADTKAKVENPKDIPIKIQ